ncbi:MAG: endonuclease domain-containing protein [Ruminococcaceae bacterium]|nr:endonuclease domain-containing protein [Oscillospiraceae bacterium]
MGGITRNHNLLTNARILRKEMTPQERHLWYDYLRYYPVKIYKQRIIDNYIADFYCAKARLVIELDGSQHYTSDGREYDSIRTEVIQKYNLEVIHFLNGDVDNKFNGVCSVIDRTIKERLEKIKKSE